ncbi:lipoprotein insertase outer membrane protein LolB [Pontibacter sp. JAM-7]|uniref:lipoprotein insertase outer membrane protein LolB n=1 Tax=Pontibacter sp. JAM-7 TaxID=3366581 RepID=UPI003AF57D03
MKLWLATLLSILILSGCSSAPPQPPMASDSWELHQQTLSQLKDWTLKGKIGIRTPQDSQSANLKWVQASDNYQIDIRGPWGQGGASLYGNPGAVTVDVAGEGIFRGSSPDALLEEYLGWHLPVSQFYWWIRGLPAPGPSSTLILEQNRLSLLRQAGWQVEFLAYHSGSPTLPRKLRLQHGQLTILIVIHDWISGAAPDV